jgi:hypothetical protein
VLAMIEELITITSITGFALLFVAACISGLI